MMRWKAHFFLNGEYKENDTKTFFGFKSRYHPPPCTELEHFEKDLINIIINVKFTKNMNSFQRKLCTDLTEIKISRNSYIFADKTNNIYRMPTSEHNETLKEYVTKTYKKAPKKLQKWINLERESIETKLKLCDRIDEAPVYVTLKDHKENFWFKSFDLLIPSEKILGKSVKLF